MGLSMGFAKCMSNPYRNDCCAHASISPPVFVPVSAPLPNPSPERFSILRSERVGDYLILMVHYPDCTNFEGVKIMVYQGFADTAALLAASNGKLDPHFCPHGPSPLVRFKPNEKGFDAAIAYAKSLGTG